MSEKLIKNVLVKLIMGGSTDRVLFIDNIPEELFYEMRHPKKVAMVNDNPNTQYWTEDKTKEKIPTLYEEIALSQTGDGGLVFNMENNNAKSRWESVTRYITSHYPSNKVPPKAVPFATSPKDPRSPALALSEVPRVVLPVLSPSVNSVAVDTTADSAPAALDVEAIKAQAIKEYEAKKKAEATERMAKARAARASK